MRFVVVLAAMLMIGSSICGAVDALAPAGNTFSVSFPASASSVPLDGRIILLLSHDSSREPRTHVQADEPLDAPYLFGMNIEGMAPEHSIVDRKSVV